MNTPLCSYNGVYAWRNKKRPAVHTCRVLVDDMADPALCQQPFFKGTLLSSSLSAEVSHALTKPSECLHLCGSLMFGGLTLPALQVHIINLLICKAVLSLQVNGTASRLK